ncbi:MAG: DUF4214 domain-containing protein [Acidobacteria bacterium]|nr:DUF4214 domain-containing protein [Acidobacteriota bacterium]
MPYPSSRGAVVSAVAATLVLSVVVVAAAAVAAGTVSFGDAYYEVEEGAKTAQVTLSRSGGADGALTAKVSLADVTTSPADYRISPGSADSSFGSVSPVAYFYYNQEVALQPDGKILTGGFLSSLRRLNPDGTTDGSFVPPAFNAPVEVVALQPDGKVIVSGSFTGIPGAIRIARLNADGSLDSSFNTGAGLNDFAVAIAVQPDGKIVIGGYFTSVNQTAHQHIARLNADGSVDSSFNGFGSFNVYALALQTDGKILACGPYPGLVRFNADGTPDSGFQSSFGGDAVAPQSDGTIILGGYKRDSGGTIVANGVYRLNSDGSQDNSFHTGLGSDNGFTGVAVQPDGKIIAGGYLKTYDGQATGNLIRLNADGTLDPTFTVTQPTNTNATIQQIIMQPDGKVLAAGDFTVPAGNGYRTNLARFNGDLFVNWAAGDAADKTVSIPIVDDLLDEPDETATLTVTPLTPGSSAGAIPTATLTILDNDVPPQFTSGAPARAIAGQFYTHTFQASGSPAPTFTLTAGSLPPGFFLTSAGVLQGTTSTPGTFSNVTVTASNGVSPAATQTFDLVVASGGALQFDASAYSVSENAGTATITVNRVGGSAGATSVNFVITGNTATSGSDFVPANTTLNFADGETSKTVTVTIIDDAVNERDEFANLFLNTVTGTGRLGTPTVGSLNILNDDPLPTIAVDDINVTEGDSGTKLATFTVTRTGLTDRFINFTARTSDGSAAAGEDYLALTPTTFQLSPSAASTTVSVSVLGDTIIEPDKSFALLLTSPVNASVADGSGVCVIKDNDTTTGPPTVQFAMNEFRAQESAGIATVTVTRSGDSSSPTSVTYSTALLVGTPPPGVAWDRNDYTYTSGTLRFAAGETSKTFQVFIADDALVEGDETLTVTLSGPTGGTGLGAPATSSVRIIDNDTAPSTANPVDDTAFFVRQHYRDFLGRDPDASGLAFWTGEIEQCGADAQCREVKRINVSAAFFLSIEFQQTGYFDYLLYKAAFNTGERLSFPNFTFDTLQLGRDVVVGTEGWEQKVASNKQAFVDSFVARSTFTSTYPQSVTPDQFVDALNANTGDPLNPSAGGALTKAERDGLVADLASGAKTRAQVLRAVAENAEFRRRQLSKAFVLMQYFGYLRRAPNATPDTAFDGYNFWLGKLNEFQGNYINAEMVRAFITSDEYRKRFGQ